MMKRIGIVAVVVLIVAAAVLALPRLARPRFDPGECQSRDRPPRIRPDYADVVVPPNIAPMNFVIDESGVGYHVKFSSAAGDPIELDTASGKVIIPEGKWRQLLAANRGEILRVEVFRLGEDGRWGRFEAITNRIAREEIDSHLAYRKIKPLYNQWGPIGAYQRNVETYEETALLHNDWWTDDQDGCMHCHTFRQNRPDQMIMHVRGPGGGMLVIRGSEFYKVDTRTQYNPAPAAFASWHPSGKLLAFSVDKVRQFFHTVRPEVRDAIDMNSDLALYLFESNEVVSSSKVRRPDQLETFPEWSRDGKFLYFCRAPRLWTEDKVPPEHYRDVRYSLMRIAYDIETGEWGEVETVLSAEETGGSMTQPKISPDGRFLVFCMSDYSSQPSFQPSADLYLLKLETGEYRRLECNSSLSESWHGWSSNGRWLVFSSKRSDGQFIRPYFSYVDSRGRAHKAFVLPQKAPAFYDSCIMLYQYPELIVGPIPEPPKAFLRVVRSEGMIQSDAVSGATPRHNPTSEGR